jgi:hypothetical protein
VRRLRWTDWGWVWTLSISIERAGCRASRLQLGPTGTVDSQEWLSHAIVDQVGIVDQGVKQVKAGISPQRAQSAQGKQEEQRCRASRQRAPGPPHDGGKPGATTRAEASVYTEPRNACSEFSALLCACPSSRRVSTLSLAFVSSKKKRGQTSPPPLPRRTIQSNRYRSESRWSLAVTAKSARQPWSTQIPCLFVPQLYPLVQAEPLRCESRRTSPPRVSTEQECLRISSELHAIVWNRPLSAYSPVRVPSR